MGVIQDARFLRTLTVQNQDFPPEGPAAIPLLLDFTVPADGNILVDLSEVEQQNRISMIQTIFIDMSKSGVALVVQDFSTGMEIVAAPRTQGYYQFACSNPTKLIFNCVAGPAGLKIFLFNVAIPGAVWAATHP
jgi:hypothetical protein